MMTGPSRVAIAEFALRTVARSGRSDWLVLVVPEGAVDEIAASLAAEIESLGECPVERVKNPAGAREMVRAVHDAHREKLVLVFGLDGFSPEEWGHVDLLRSRLVRERPVVVLVSAQSIENLIRKAPNLASWIGGSVWEADLAAECLSDDEKRMRLRSLREWSGLSDDEVVRRAQEGTLPDDPEFAEWLVLLARVDLLGT